MEALEPRALLAGDVIIAEFQAINGSTIADKDGDFSDWVSHAFDAETALADSRRCLNCHPEMSTHAFSPHGICPQKLSKRTQSFLKNETKTFSEEEKQTLLFATSAHLSQI